MFFYRNPLKWVQDQKLVAEDPNLSFDGFGRAVAMSADAGTVVAGSWSDGDKNTGASDYYGAFYIFKKDGDQYNKAHKFVGSETGLYLGTNPAITADGSKVAIGASGDDTLAVDAGAIHIYESGSGGYVETQKILLGDTDPANDWVGWPDIRLDPTGEFLFVASITDGDTGTPVQPGGAVYILQSGSNGYQQIQKITSEDSSTFALGCSIEISEDKQALIAYTKGATIGADEIHVYESGGNGYELSQNLSVPLSYEIGGAELRINQDKTRIVARTFGTVSGVWVGNILIFEKNQGSYELVQQISDSSGDGFFSLQLNSAGDMFAVGAIGYDNNGLSYAGGVLIYESGSNGFENVQTLTGGTTDVSMGGARFGESLAMNPGGTEIIVGAPNDQTSGYNAGAAFYFKKVENEFQLVQQLSGSTDWSSENLRFGFRGISYNQQTKHLAVSVASDDNITTNAGSLYLFEETENGFERFKVIDDRENPDSSGDYFSYEPHFNENKNLLFFGAWRHDLNGTRAGAAFVYANTAGTKEYSRVQVLTASGDVNPDNDAFGITNHTDESGEILAVGSPYDEVDGSARVGSVYIFQSSSSGYQQAQKLTASGDSNVENDNFGRNVKVGSSGNIIAIGAWGDENSLHTASAGVGSVYIFQSSSSGYVQTQNISASYQPSDPLHNDWATGTELQYFGNYLDLSSDEQTLVVSAHYEGDTHGAVYVFEKDENGNFEEIQKVIPPDPMPAPSYGASFGSGVKLYLNYLVVIAAAEMHDPQDLTNFSPRGAAYVYEKNNTGYVLKQKIMAPEGVDWLGSHINPEAKDGKLFIPSYYADNNGNNSGEVEIYKLTRDY